MERETRNRPSNAQCVSLQGSLRAKPDTAVIRRSATISQCRNRGDESTSVAVGQRGVVRSGMKPLPSGPFGMNGPASSGRGNVRYGQRFGADITGIHASDA